ncbi:MAG: 4Fe-4S dicluster domain-containing protein [Thermoplasmata archaeon]
MARYAFVVDLDRCMGCRACVEACKIENNTPEGFFWMHVFRFEEGSYPDVRVRFMPRPCMHCDNPPCVKVCPVGARYKQNDGFVLTDYERCIGCRYCEVACPYGVNYFNYGPPQDNTYYDWRNGEGDNEYGTGSISDYTDGKIPPYRNPDFDKTYGEKGRLVAGSGHFVGVIEKCTWCVHRVEKGLEPACVQNCPVGALLFGDLDDPESTVSKRLAEKPSFRLLEHLGTEPRVFYVGEPAMGEDARETRLRVAQYAGVVR